VPTSGSKIDLFTDAILSVSGTFTAASLGQDLLISVSTGVAVVFVKEVLLFSLRSLKNYKNSKDEQP